MWDGQELARNDLKERKKLLKNFTKNKEIL